MAHVETEGDDRLILRKKKCMGLILSGLFMCGLGYGAIALDIPIEDAPDWTLPAVGYGLIALGAMLVLGRGGAVIDRRSGTITKWSGLLVPLFKSTRRVEPNAVHLAHEVYRYRGHVTHWYPINLACTGGSIALDRPDSATHAWAVAQSIADFLGVRFIDESNG